METEVGLAPGRRLRREDFWRVNSEHIREAVQALLGGSEDHPFAESTDYDVLLDDGTRLAPKAVFGVAARRTLRLDLGPPHFKGGDDTPCFRFIRAAGFAIVPKGGDEAVLPDPDQSSWIEGNARRESHIRYERDPKAVRKKKQAFRDKHGGRLGCEECELFPVEHYGKESGEACIEVHHRVPLADLGKRRTTLDDLMCVCANCHRILHHEMRAQTKRERSKLEKP